MKKIIGSDKSILSQQLALILFLFFPITFSIVFQSLRISSFWDLIEFLQYGFLVAILLTLILTIFATKSIWESPEQFGNLPIIWVVGLAIVSRIILIQIISTNFVSDMEDIHLFASDIYSGNPTTNLHNYPNIPSATYLTMTGMVLSILYKLFGASTTIAKISLVLLAGLSTWLIFLVGRELVNFRVGFMAALFHATLPSLICYTGVLTGDHFAIPLMLLAILIHLRISKLDKNKHFSFVGGYAICGAVIGLVDWFRPIGLILSIALMISMVLHFVGKKRVYYLTLGIGSMILAYFVISNIAVRIVENSFQVKPFSIIQEVGGQLLVGLNPETNGGVTNDDKKTSRDIYALYGNDYAAANKYLIRLAFDRLRKYDISLFFVEKFSLIWSSHDALFDYSLSGSNDQDLVNLLRDLEMIWYLILTTFILVNVLSSIFTGSHPAIFAMQLFILGFAIIMLFFEIQNRYVIIVIPYSIILSVLGLESIFSMIETRRTLK